MPLHSLPTRIVAWQLLKRGFDRVLVDHVHVRMGTALSKNAKTGRAQLELEFIAIVA